MKTSIDDLTVLQSRVVAAVERAGSLLLSRFKASARPADIQSISTAIAANDAAVIHPLREALLAALPGSRWVENEEGEGVLPAGDWWIVDPVEGNINHIHGRAGWGVTATLIRNGAALLTVATVPLAGETYSAIEGNGAYLNGRALVASAKRHLNAAIVGTCQARPGEDAATYARMASSVEGLLANALLVRMSVPSTLELLDVASGKIDGFWQFSQVRSGLASGALLVKEAGGCVSDSRGEKWTLESKDFVAAAPGVHAAMVDCLSQTEDLLVEQSA
ncbi:inositol monophosphatase family protein [Pseudomonas sp. PWP3-1b2]|uniref:inositol monophosphatase family protein n=1 Tax=Pseudomonas sp. PWP3-1b2 TaxID=2804656 RepID=UPI003CF8EA10